MLGGEGGIGRSYACGFHVLIDSNSNSKQFGVGSLLKKCCHVYYYFKERKNCFVVIASINEFELMSTSRQVLTLFFL